MIGTGNPTAAGGAVITGPIPTATPVRCTPTRPSGSTRLGGQRAATTAQTTDPPQKGADMGLIHAWRMQKLVSDARTAFNQGDVTFSAGFDIDTRRRVSMKHIRKEIDLIINAVEPIGWQCVSVEPFFASVEIDFVRQP
ncbi:hypothetical protein [Micromonospora sp. NPDC002717]|uniref:hypothetical protein n=1 Tax=Micromonospora sp. NPDC002717 TaxID=3154424 RepID=UPI00332AA69B